MTKTPALGNDCRVIARHLRGTQQWISECLHE